VRAVRDVPKQSTPERPATGQRERSMTTDEKEEKAPVLVETQVMEPTHQSIYDIEIDITEILDRLEAERLLSGE
jgi:hypothetical protein